MGSAASDLDKLKALYGGSRRRSLIQSDQRILVLVHWTGRGKGSGAQVEGRGAHLWTFRQGVAIRFDAYRDRDEARAALERG